MFDEMRAFIMAPKNKMAARMRGIVTKLSIPLGDKPFIKDPLASAITIYSKATGTSIKPAENQMTAVYRLARNSFSRNSPMTGREDHAMM